ncbi:ALF repeat-containing protein [Dactylosporangium vinaceum]|uniref:ALF repeat-containing protein n=1 Tax=Dactylosporangium vinaceum TaxID=53362 RepID=A0ABV5LZE7_9ACTN|nr:ALF repeat-containing protein [Dactylosporangium vinaceum]UAB92601.1 ALF repeat-containing protein [Dactylosporangium vinaceum]
MRWKIPAALILAATLLVPAASAAAQSASPGPAATTCETVVYTDIRTLVTIDLDTATDTQVRILANQILSAAVADRLSVLPGRVQARLDGTPADLRAFLKSGVAAPWSTDLRIKVNQALAGGGPNVQNAAQIALDAGTVDGFLQYLNDGLYIARAQDSGTYRQYSDIRSLITINLDTASDTEVRVVANQILARAQAEKLTVLRGRLQTRLDGAPADLRAFLKHGVLQGWAVDLLLRINQAMAAGGPSVRAAAQVALDTNALDASLAFLDHGLYLARAQDCVS